MVFAINAPTGDAPRHSSKRSVALVYLYKTPYPGTLQYYSLHDNLPPDQQHTRHISLSNDVQSPRPSAASLCDTSDKLPRGIRTYARYAELDHLPRILMTASSTPAAAADVAAPMQKLWPEYGAGSTPTDDNASLIRLTSTCRVSCWPFCQTNSGPGCSPRTSM